MKKNFLLLLLMSLLPLAGWAQDISDYKVEINGDGTLTYSGAAQTILLNVKLDNASDPIAAASYDILYFDEDKNAIEEDDVKNAGTYYAAAKGKSPLSGTTEKVKFTISPRNMSTTTVGDFDALTYDGTAKTYADNAFTGKVTVADPAITLVKGTDYEVAYSNNINVGSGTTQPTITFTGKGNFTGTKTKTFTINSKNLPDYSTTAYVMTAAASYTYSGAIQEPTFTVKDGTKTLVAGTDYEVKWYTGDAPNVTTTADAAVEAKAANIYRAKIFGKGNYNSEAGNGVFNDAWTFTIGKKALTVDVKDREKFYDGQPYTLDAMNDVILNGLVTADLGYAELDGVTFTVNENPAAFTGTNAGTYTVKAVVDADDFTFKKNYSWNTVTPGSAGTMVIKKRPITITAKALEATYTGVAPTAIPAINDENYTTYLEALTKATATNNEGVLVDNEGNYVAAELNDVLSGITVAFKNDLSTYIEKGTYEGAIQVTKTANYEGNYDITAGADANYTVNGIKFSLSANNCQLYYGANDEEIAALDFYATSGLGGAALPNDAVIAYYLKTMDGDDITIDEAVKKTGNYKVYIDTANTNIPAFGNFTGANINENPATLTINARPITIKPKAMSIAKGSTLADLKKLAQLEEIEGLVEGDVIAYKFAFGDGVTLTDGKITNDVNAVIEGGVKVVEATDEDDEWDDEAEYANDNYSITWGTANLTITAEKTLVLDSNDEQLFEKIEIASDDCDADEETTYTVKFGGARVLKAGKWESFVLPFEIRVADLSVAMSSVEDENGYAIFNMYNEATSDAENVRFSMVMDKIPANTPFLIKTEKNVTLNTNVTIKNVKIVAPTSANPTKEVAGKAVMTGCYADTKITSNDKFFFQGTWMSGSSDANDPTILPATMAYWTPASAEARVFVEEFDNVTGIKTVEIGAGVNGNAVKDGWYNLNGMKLQGAPIQKGVYIYNGKKFVVK